MKGTIKLNGIVLVMVISLLTRCAKQSPEAKFWKWFAKNEAQIYEFEDSNSAILDEISLNLGNYKEGIVFEISAIIEGKREFIISADGLKELFPLVQSLHEAAPKLKRWDFTAFRPRMENYSKFKLEYSGKDFDPESIWFHSIVEGNSFDLILYHPEYADGERDSFINGTYILLDMALGEYDVVTGIRYIDHQKIPDDPENEGLRPFSDLRKSFDDFKRTKANKYTSFDKLFVYMANYEGVPGSTVVDMDLKNHAPVKAYPTVVVTGVHFIPQDEGGLPKTEDLDFLYDLSEKRLNLIREKTHSLLAGTFAHNGERLDYIYVMDPTGIDELLRDFYTQHVQDAEIYINIKDDPEWGMYLDFLYPNKATRRYYKKELKELGITN